MQMEIVQKCIHAIFYPNQRNVKFWTFVEHTVYFKRFLKTNENIALQNFQCISKNAACIDQKSNLLRA